MQNSSLLPIFALLCQGIRGLIATWKKAQNSKYDTMKHTEEMPLIRRINTGCLRQIARFWENLISNPQIGQNLGENGKEEMFLILSPDTHKHGPLQFSMWRGEGLPILPLGCTSGKTFEHHYFYTNRHTQTHRGFRSLYMHHFPERGKLLQVQYIYRLILEKDS